MAKPLHITIYYEIGTVVTAKAIQEQLHANPDASEIVLHINSPGGSVYEGYTIYNLLLHSGKKITAKVEGICASIATLIALSASEIEMLPMAQWLIHNPFAGIEGDADELARASDQLRAIENTIAELYALKTGKEVQEIKDLMKEDRFLNANEALALGFATRIAEPLKAVAFYTPPKTNPINNVMTEEQQNSFADKIINGIAGFFKAPKAEAETPAPVAASEPLEGGETIYFEGELAEGTLVYSDAEMTALVANGEHVLGDGRAITVTDGAVTAITEPEPANSADLEAAMAKIAELENQLAGIQNNISEKDKTIVALKAQARKATVATPAQAFAGDPAPTTSSVLNELAKNLKRK